MGRRRRLSGGGGSSTADEIADGISAFTSTFNTMNQAFDRADQMKMAKQEMDWKTEDRAMAKEEMAAEKEFGDVWQGYQQGHVSPIMKAANRRGMFGEGAAANGYKIVGEGEGDQKTPALYFNVTDKEGNESMQRFGTVDQMGAALMFFAPTKMKVKMAENALAVETDPVKQAQYASMLEQLKAQRFENQTKPKMHELDMQGKQLGIAEREMNLVKGQEDLKHTQEVRPHQLIEADAKARKAQQEADLYGKYGEQEMVAGINAKSQGKAAPIRYVDQNGNEFSEQGVMAQYRAYVDNVQGTETPMGVTDFFAKSGIRPMQSGVVGSPSRSSATGLAAGAPPWAGQTPGADPPPATTQKTPPAEQNPPVQGARKAPDGNWYIPNPDQPGKYLRVKPQ